LVSIPQWCDCCQSFEITNPEKNLVSIPQWCDCCCHHRISSWKLNRGFNPTMVRLLLWQVFPNISNAEKCFNPTMVRLLLSNLAQYLTHTLVSIPQWCDCCWFPATQWLLTFDVSIPQWCDCCVWRLRFLPLFREFQSHNGAIAAFCPPFCKKKGWIGFNPTMVRLLHYRQIGLSANWTSFNPTMVRLLLCTCGEGKVACSKFQSHNGAIAARTWQWMSGWTQCRFNPTMVRLLRLNSLLEFVYPVGVSIPQWCDCCKDRWKVQV